MCSSSDSNLTKNESIQRKSDNRLDFWTFYLNFTFFGVLHISESFRFFSDQFLTRTANLANVHNIENCSLNCT